MSLNQDLTSCVIKKLPVTEQLPAAIAIFGTNSEYTNEFYKRDEFFFNKGEDILQGSLCWFTKDGETFDGGSFEIQRHFTIDSLPDVLPSQGVHKLSVWQDMRKQGFVTEDYCVSIKNTIETDDEVVNIYLTVRNIKESLTEFSATFDVEAFESSFIGEYIACGSKEIKFSVGDIPDMHFAQGNIVEDTFTPTGVEIYKYEDGTTVTTCNPPYCEMERYTFGVGKEVMKSIFA